MYSQCRRTPPTSPRQPHPQHPLPRRHRPLHLRVLPYGLAWAPSSALGVGASAPRGKDALEPWSDEDREAKGWTDLAAVCVLAHRRAVTRREPQWVWAEVSGPRPPRSRALPPSLGRTLRQGELDLHSTILLVNIKTTMCAEKQRRDVPSASAMACEKVSRGKCGTSYAPCVYCVSKAKGCGGPT